MEAKRGATAPGFKPFTAEGRFECGLEEARAGRLAALVAVAQPAGLGLGLAIANEAGYLPVPLAWCHGPDFAQLQRHADELNAAWYRLDALTAARIAASSMLAGRVEAKAKATR